MKKFFLFTFEKDDKIDKLQQDINTMIKTNEDMNIKMNTIIKLNKRLEKSNTIIKDQLDDANINILDIKEDLTDTNHKLNVTCKKLNIAVEDRVPKTDDQNKYEDFILLRSTDKDVLYKYYAVRGQTIYVNRKAKNKVDNEQYTEILRIDNVANSVNIWHRLKENLNAKVEFCGNESNLITINENQFITTIKNI